MLLAALALVQVGQWHLDGDAGGAELEGRADYRDSAISGKALVFNGVDTVLKLKVSATPDWTFSLWIYPSEPTNPAVWEWNGMTLEIGKDGSLSLFGVRTEPGRVFPGQWHHVAAVTNGYGLHVYLNGELVLRGKSKGVFPPPGPVVVGRGFRGLVDEIRFTNVGIGASDVCNQVDVGLPWARCRASLTGAFPAGKFFLDAKDVVAFMGGQNVEGLATSGRLEAWASLAVPGVRFRSLAWEGDTVFEQRRDLNFGPWKRYLERSGATVLLVQFGQMEALRGVEGLPSFMEAYGKLLTDLAERTRRIVVLSPTPFGKTEPPLPDLSARNGDVARYAQACRELAYKRGFVFVDLSETAVPTLDGVHWTGRGLDAVSSAVAKALEIPERPAASDLIDAIREKNRLWYDHWRPMNWAFLEGDRTEQPSGRDHLDRRLRWFPVEMQDYLPLLRRQEAKIGALLK